VRGSPRILDVRGAARARCKQQKAGYSKLSLEHDESAVHAETRAEL
jgi:hypothetical protein